MWPFTSKKIAAPVYSVPEQLSLSLKSFTLPELTPRWSLFTKRQELWQPEAAIRDGYNASAVVYAAVEKRAKLLASVPWKAEKLVNGEWEHDPNSDLQKLIDSPNPDMSWYELIYEASQSLDLTGNAFLSEIKGGSRGLPFEMWLLPSQHVRIMPGRERIVEYYEYVEGGISGRYRINAEDMIQLKMPNPNSRWFGMPVLMAAGRATDVDRESGDWQKASLQNRGVVDVHIEVPPEVTAEQRQEMRDKWQERQAGPANARAPIISSGKVNQLGQTAVEMDFVASRKAVWSEICAVFGVPMAALGFTESVNLANAEAMNKMLWQDTVVPQLDLLERQFTHQLAREFGPEWRMKPDLSNIEALQENLGDKLANAERLQRLGFTRNEINARLELGFDESPDGNVSYLPVGMIPFDVADPALEDEEKRVALRLAYGA
jgi:HK97 family phage portal protein